jgi:hypothetical protein
MAAFSGETVLNDAVSSDSVLARLTCCRWKLMPLDGALLARVSALVLIPMV